MKKLLQKIVLFCTDERQPLKTRLFRVIHLLGVLTAIAITISNLGTHVSKVSVACSASAIFLLIIGLWLTTKLKKCDNLFTGVLIMLNSFLFPIAYIYSGGVDSGTPVWLTFGLILIFIFLEGKRFVLVLCTSLASLLALYVMALRYPEVIHARASQAQVLFASCFAIILLGILAGAIFFFQRRLYEKSQQLAEEQAKTIRQISDARNLFFANMSHEIRTPINTIIGLNEMTLREDISDEVAENAVNIQNASKILLALINDILDLSKIESGRMEIVPAQYETSSLFSDLVNIIWIRAQQKNLEFHIDIDEETPSVLYGDEVRIKQVLVNLLNNAVKYTPKGSVSLSVKSERIDTNLVQLRMAVRDTGIGIKSENIENLFSSFKRVDEQNNRHIEGTGLGLSIAKQLVDLMGGTITVDSIYTKGSVFTVTLDQQIVSDAPLGSMSYAVRQNRKERKKYERRFEAPEAHVLIVDDNEMNLMVAKKLLRATRVQIDTAASGMECLQKTMGQFYHVIFMDHLMPEMDGEETLHALRERTEGYCQETPVIALTANVMSNAAEHYAAMGFDGYIAKPINAAVFEAVLQKFLPPDLIEYMSAEAEDEIADRISSIMVQGKKKKHLRITTDCVCDLPEELVKQYEIGMMYYYVTTEQGRFKDIAEISSRNLLEYMNHGNKAKSNPASVEEYETFFADNLMEAEMVVHISMSSKVSGGFANAARAAHGFNNVMVLDSGHLSSGLGLIVLEAAKLAQKDAGLEQIRRTIEIMKERISTNFITATPDNLYLSGRIHKRVYKLAHALQLHPVLTLSNGRMWAPRVYFGKMEVCSPLYIHYRLRAKRRIDNRVLFVTHSGCTMAQLEMIREEVEKCMHFEKIYFQPATSAIASNSGIGAFGLIYMKK